MGVCWLSKLKFNEILNYFDNLNIDIIELGDQDIVIDNGQLDSNHKFRNDNINKFKSWRTLDLHLIDGVEIFDLSILSNEKNCADIITNFGTSEHIEENIGQYNCWLNIHNFLKNGGYAIHMVPPPNYWINHCRYYYTKQFFQNFENFGYDIIELEMTYNNLLLCIMKKIKNIDFMSYDNFINNIIFINTDYNNIDPKNNPKNLKWN